MRYLLLPGGNRLFVEENKRNSYSVILAVGKCFFFSLFSVAEWFFCEYFCFKDNNILRFLFTFSRSRYNRERCDLGGAEEALGAT